MLQVYTLLLLVLFLQDSLIFAAVHTIATAAVANEKSYKNCFKLNSLYDVRFFWTLNNTHISARIQGQMTATKPSKGYIAVGIYPIWSNQILFVSGNSGHHGDSSYPSGGTHKFADLWAIGSTSATAWIVGDYYMTGTSPMRDPTSDDLTDVYFGSNVCHGSATLSINCSIFSLLDSCMAALPENYLLLMYMIIRSAASPPSILFTHAIQPAY